MENLITIFEQTVILNLNQKQAKKLKQIQMEHWTTLWIQMEMTRIPYKLARQGSLS